MKKTFDIELLRKKDPVLFREFFDWYYPKLMAFGCRFVDSAVAEDLVQDVFISFWECLDGQPIDNPSSFLFRSLQNSCLNYLKRQLLKEEYEARLKIAEVRIAYLNDTPDIFTKLAEEDLQNLIEESIEKLSPKCATAFRLAFFQQLSHKEIAEIMNISHRTVEGHIQQAVSFLRKDLKPLFLLIFMF